MDTGTVLSIIKMIDKEIFNIELEYADSELFLISHDHPAHDIRNLRYYEQQILAPLTKLKDHLQSFIEGQLNALENQTGE
jgi:esterase/lipase superfamily enzyme